MQEHINYVRRTCVFCGGAFFAKRSDAKFCTPRHRQAYYRWRVKIQYLQAKGHYFIMQLGEYLTYDDSRGASIAALTELRGDVTDLFSHYHVGAKR